MQQLLEDPQTLTFTSNNKIHLGKLKKEIDRRITKIRRMLGQHQRPTIQILQKINKSSQTRAYDITPVKDLHHVLGNKMPLSNIIDVESETSQRRSSVPVSKKKHSKQISHDECSLSKKKGIKQEYLSIRNSLAPESTEKNEIQKMQDDKIFDSKDFELFGGFGFRDSKSIEGDSPNFNIPLNFNESDEDRSDCSSLYNRKKRSYIGSRAPSQKKNRFTDRTAAESESRFVVTPECQMRMMELVDKLTQAKRREAQDSKLRENIIKKIDEKYGAAIF